jgi:hypothetical protein
MDPIERRIIEILKRSPTAMKAWEIAAELERQTGEKFDRTDVNRLLYGKELKGLLFRTPQGKWRLWGGGSLRAT